MDQDDRAAGVVISSAAGDALGAPHEFGPPLADSFPLKMTGGGAFNWGPGEWTDDTQTALAILVPLARHEEDLVGSVAKNLIDWMASNPADVGNQTRAVLTRAIREDRDLAEVTAEWAARNPDASGNGSLMRTGPVALVGGDRTERAEVASALSALTHASEEAREACILWTDACARAINRPDNGPMDWIDHVREGVELLAPERRGRWNLYLDETTGPRDHRTNGYVVAALQDALAALATTPVPFDHPHLHLRLAIERAVRTGGDTDTVAAICGALAGAYWGASAVPVEWREALNGYRIRGEGVLVASDLERWVSDARAAGPGPA